MVSILILGLFFPPPQLLTLEGNKLNVCRWSLLQKSFVGLWIWSITFVICLSLPMSIMVWNPNILVSMVCLVCKRELRELICFLFFFRDTFTMSCIISTCILSLRNLLYHIQEKCVLQSSFCTSLSFIVSSFACLLI